MAVFWCDFQLAQRSKCIPHQEYVRTTTRFQKGRSLSCHHPRKCGTCGVESSKKTLCSSSYGSEHKLFQAASRGSQLGGVCSWNLSCDTWWTANQTMASGAETATFAHCSLGHASSFLLAVVARRAMLSFFCSVW
jgi:hypothetical protein